MCLLSSFVHDFIIFRIYGLNDVAGFRRVVLEAACLRKHILVNKVTVGNYCWS